MILDFNLSISEPFKIALDATAAGTALAAMVAVVPATTSILALVWVLWRLYNEYLITKKLKEK